MEKKVENKKSTNNPTPVKGGKNYYTHNNGGRPFMVNIKGRKVKIYKLNSDDIDDVRDIEKPENYQKMIKEYDAKKIFIGNDVSPNFGQGNSIVFEVENGNFVYVGSEIYQFKPEDKILSYNSFIGNSDVPYPVLLGKYNAYFMIERKYAPLEPTFVDVPVEEMYEVFYDLPKSKTYNIKGLKTIHKHLW